MNIIRFLREEWVSLAIIACFVAFGGLTIWRIATMPPLPPGQQQQEQQDIFYIQINPHSGDPEMVWIN